MEATFIKLADRRRDRRCDFAAQAACHVSGSGCDHRDRDVCEAEEETVRVTTVLGHTDRAVQSTLANMAEANKAEPLSPILTPEFQLFARVDIFHAHLGNKEYEFK